MLICSRLVWDVTLRVKENRFFTNFNFVPNLKVTNTLQIKLKIYALGKQLELQMTNKEVKFNCQKKY